MYKLRQTWNEVFPVRTLYDIDVRVQKIDPAWPITANLSGGKSSSTSVSKNVPTKPAPPPQVNVVNVVNNMTHTHAVASSLSMKSISSSTSVNIQEVKYCFNFHSFSSLYLSLFFSFIINTSKSDYFSEYCM
jgi:hypothetical protein